MFLDVGKPNFISCLFCCWLVFHFILLSFFKNHTAVFLPLSFYTFLLILSFSLCPFSIYFFHSLSSSCHFLTPPDFYPTSSYLLAPTPMFFLLFLWAFGSQAPLLTCIFQAWSHWPQTLHWNCHTLLLRNPSVQLLVPSLVRKFASPRRNLLCFSSSYQKKPNPNPTESVQQMPDPWGFISSLIAVVLRAGSAPSSASGAHHRSEGERWRSLPSWSCWMTKILLNPTTCTWCITIFGKMSSSFLTNLVPVFFLFLFFCCLVGWLVSWLFLFFMMFEKIWVTVYI